MTSKQIYEATAIELSKVQAPALKLYEFNYFFNQAIRQFVNKVYNVYDVNQQTTDDLRVLKATATLKPNIAESTGNRALDYLRGATYYVDMPDDYLHLLNCICLFDVNKNKECWNKGDVMVVGATKLTADSWSSVVDDVYNQPTKKRPYYYVHNQNEIFVHDENLTERNSELPTLPDMDKLHSYEWEAYPKTATSTPATAAAEEGDEATGDTENTDTNVSEWGTITGDSNFKRTFDYVGTEPDEKGQYTKAEYDAIEKPAGSRHANSSRVKVEIRCGRDKSNIFSLSAVQVDYVKAPQFIRLTQEQLDSDEDISQVMEFPDYVNQEIVNELVNLVMRKTNDPSLNAHMQMTQTIARPTGQSAQPAAQA
jgi:hypothetical protein